LKKKLATGENRDLEQVERRISRSWFTLTRVAVGLVLIGSVTLSVVCAVYAVRASNDRLSLSRGLLGLVEKDPGEALYQLRCLYPEGELLKLAFSEVRDESEEEFNRAAALIGDKLMGEKQVEFISGVNQYGVQNAQILGYLSGCLRAIGANEGVIPYPVDHSGFPYEGSQETVYDLEVSRVVGSSE